MSEVVEGGAGLADRLARGVLVLVGLPILVELLALDPVALLQYEEPIKAALRLALTNTTPYLALAVSCGLLAVLARRAAIAVAPPTRSASLRWGVLALLVGGGAAFAARSIAEVVLAGDARVDHGRLRLGGAGPLAPSLPLEPLALESLGELGTLHLPAREQVWSAQVRWVAMRSTDPGPAADTSRIELLAGGTRRDVTADFRLLQPGEARLMTRTVRLGPGPARVHLRLVSKPAPPVVFLDARRALDWHGIALDVGGGDRAYHVSTTAAPGVPHLPAFTIEGEHAADGHTVVVLSGTRWQRHDLGTLLQQDAALELLLARSPAMVKGDASEPPWEVRLVGHEVAGEPAALEGLTAVEEDPSLVRFSRSLRSLDLGAVPVEEVVGVALTYRGPSGPFRLQLVDARVTVPQDAISGFALATTSALDPGARPHDTLLVAGDPGRGSTLAPFTFGLRLLAALLAIFAAVGVRGLVVLLAGWPLAVLACIVAGPGLTALLEPVLGAALLLRIEHVPLALAAVALALVASRRLLGVEPQRSSASPQRERDPRAPRQWVDALLGAAILGIVALHASADPAGLPYPAFDPQTRLFPALLHSLTMVLDYPIFILGFLFLIARGLAGRSYREVVRGSFRRLMVPYLFWTVAFLVVRHGKALAFGYHEAYRHELASGASWVTYLLLGGAQYHLHLLPLLFCLTVLHPLFRPALRRPWLAGLLLVTLCLWPVLDGVAFTHVASPLARDVVLMGTRAAACLGYGLLAFAVFALREPTIRVRARLLSGAAGALLVSGGVLAAYGLKVAESGTWLPLSGSEHLARYLGPAAVFLLFALVRRSAWPRALVWLGQASFGVYLVHPMLLDLAEIAERGLGLRPAPTIALNVLFVTAGSALLVAGLRRVSSLRWTVGARTEKAA